MKRASPDGQEHSAFPVSQPEGTASTELYNLAGFLDAKIKQEKSQKEHEELLERTANEIFNETFETILSSQNSLVRETQQEKKKRLSIKDRIASIETGEWRFRKKFKKPCKLKL